MIWIRRPSRWLMAILIATMLVPVRRSFAPPAGFDEWEQVQLRRVPRGMIGPDTVATPTPEPKSQSGLDVVTTSSGDILNGTVESIEPEGGVKLTGKPFPEGLRVRADALEQIVLRGGCKSEAPDEVTLSNGDRLRGRLKSITDSEIVIESDIAGDVTIPRVFAVSVGLGNGASALIDSEFASGRMEPWKSRGGSWAVSDGKLTCGGGTSVLYCELEQTEPLTLIAHVQGTDGNALRCYLVLFSDGFENLYGRGSVCFYLNRTDWYIYATDAGGSTNHLLQGNLGRMVMKGSLRIAYEPETAKIKIWLDEQLLGEAQNPYRTKTGKFVMLSSRYPSHVASLRVMRGIVAPSGVEFAAAGGGEADADVVHLGNRDRVSAQGVSLAAGRFSIRTGFGELDVGTERVGRVIFSLKGRQEPRRRKGDVEITTSGGRLTLEFGGLTEEHLVGKSDGWGDVKIRRDAVKKIRFNLYK